MLLAPPRVPSWGCQFLPQGLGYQHKAVPRPLAPLGQAEGARASTCKLPLSTLSGKQGKAGLSQGLQISPNHHSREKLTPGSTAGGQIQAAFE